MKRSWRRVLFLVDCFPVPRLLAELEPPGQWRWTWRVCLFSPLSKLHSGNSTPTPFPWGMCLPQALSWGLLLQASFQQGWLWLWGLWRIPVMVHKTFLREKGNRRDEPSCCSFELPSACISPGRLRQEDRLRDVPWGLQRLFRPSHSGLAPAPSMSLPHHPLPLKVPSRICEQMKRIKKVGCWVEGGGLYL